MMNRSWLFLYLGIGFLAISGGLLVFLIVNGTPGEGGFASRAIPFIGDDSAGTQEADGDDSGERERVRNADLSPKYRLSAGELVETLRVDKENHRREVSEFMDRPIEVRGPVVETRQSEGEGRESDFYRVGMSGTDPEEVAVFVQLNPDEYRRFEEMVEVSSEIVVVRGIFRDYNRESHTATLTDGLVVAGVSLEETPDYTKESRGWMGYHEIDHQYSITLVFTEDITDLSEPEIKDLMWVITARKGVGAASIYQWNMDKPFDREVLENTHRFDLEEKNLVKDIGTYIYLEFYPEDGFRD